jgi:hypothetical protein
VAAAKKRKKRKQRSIIIKNTQSYAANRITQKKQEIHKTQNIADTERLWTEIDTDIAMDTISESLYQKTTTRSWTILLLEKVKESVNHNRNDHYRII